MVNVTLITAEYLPVTPVRLLFPQVDVIYRTDTENVYNPPHKFLLRTSFCSFTREASWVWRQSPQVNSSCATVLRISPWTLSHHASRLFTLVGHRETFCISQIQKVKYCKVFCHCLLQRCLGATHNHSHSHSLVQSELDLLLVISNLLFPMKTHKNTKKKYELTI